MTKILFTGDTGELSGYISLNTEGVLHADYEPAQVHYSPSASNNDLILHEEVWYKNGKQYNPHGASRKIYVCIKNYLAIPQITKELLKKSNLEGVCSYEEYTDENGNIIQIIDNETQIVEALLTMQ